MRRNRQAEASARVRGNQAARAVAKLVYCCLFRDARGVFFEPVRGVIVAFFTVFETARPEGRDLALATFRAYLEGAGLREFGCGAYPLSGPQEGRTAVVLVEGGPELVERLQKVQFFAVLERGHLPAHRPVH